MGHKITWHAAEKRCSGFLKSLGVSLDDKDVLLAVSGGMDSMCMLELLAGANARLSAAHVNYGLRGAESDSDAELVKSTCLRMGITFHENRVNLKSLTDSSNESLQEKARRIRYEWFEELCKGHQYVYICTAHHQDDDAETFFVNLLRGTGLKGLAGIPVLRGTILRPMLCFTRSEISELVHTRQINFRDDTSNSERDYLRNRIRHDIIPEFQKERTHFIARLHATQERLYDEYALLEEYLRLLKSSICSEEQGTLFLDRKKLKACTSPAVILLYVIKAYGFSMAQCLSITSHPQSSGARYLSPSHELMINRDRIIVTVHKAKANTAAIQLEGDGCYMISNGELMITYVSGAQAYTDDRNIEFIDGSTITGTWALRHWRSGDVFWPLGAPGRQKLQDYFTNEKLSTIDKSNVWLLTSGDEIVWIVGIRLDHRYRITPETKEYLKLEWKPVDV